MRFAAGLAAISIGSIWLIYVGIYGGMVGSAASWLGSIGPGSRELSQWGQVVQLLSWLGPITTIAGGIITFPNPRLGGILIGISAGLLLYLMGFGFIGKVFVIPLAVIAVLAFISTPPRKNLTPAYAGIGSQPHGGGDLMGNHRLIAPNGPLWLSTTRTWAR